MAKEVKTANELAAMISYSVLGLPPVSTSIGAIQSWLQSSSSPSRTCS